jgi:hypothetical protein
METAVQVAIVVGAFALIGSIVRMVLIPYMRSKGVQIITDQEAFIAGAIDDGARFAEEMLGPKTGPEKVALALAFARQQIDKYPSVPTPNDDELKKRLHARLRVALPGHAGSATAAIAAAPSQDSTPEPNGELLARVERATEPEQLEAADALGDAPGDEKPTRRFRPTPAGGTPIAKFDNPTTTKKE